MRPRGPGPQSPGRACLETSFLIWTAVLLMIDPEHSRMPPPSKKSTFQARCFLTAGRRLRAPRAPVCTSHGIPPTYWSCRDPSGAGHGTLRERQALGRCPAHSAYDQIAAAEARSIRSHLSTWRSSRSPCARTLLAPPVHEFVRGATPRVVAWLPRSYFTCQGLCR
jgi:hypothetical protein